MSQIILLDTTILLNLLDVPQFNQDRQAVMVQFHQHIQQGDTLLLPMATLLETGNHIAGLKGNYRWHYSQLFVKIMRETLDNQTPWRALAWPTKESVSLWLDQFPQRASQGLSFGDVCLLEELQQLRKRHPLSTVLLWTLDTLLQGNT